MADAPGWLVALLKSRDEPRAAKTLPAEAASPGSVSRRLAAAGEARLATAAGRLRELPRESGNGRATSSTKSRRGLARR